MPENKKETNVDSVKKLGDFKATKLADLIGDISREKSRANVIMASIKAKRDALIAKAEDEAKAKAELHWEATKDIDEMCADAWRFQKQNPDGIQ